MRKLNTSDLFVFSRMIRKMGIKEEVKKVALEAKTGKSVESNGFELLYKLFELATEKKAEEEIYKFLAGPMECKPEEIKEMDLCVMLENVTKIADIETIKVFFKQALH